MDVRLNIKMPKVSEKVQRKIDGNRRRAYLATAAKGVEIIKERTEKHTSISGQRFKPYSQAYKESSGKTDPDLQVTGDMLGAIQAKATNSKGQIYFDAATEAAKARKNQATRPFFGFNTKEEGRLSSVYGKNLMRGVE